MAEMEPGTERLEDEIHFSERKATGREDETKPLISFEEAWQRELEYRGRITMRSPQPSICYGLPPASSQDLPPKTDIYERKRKAVSPSPPLWKEIAPSPSQAALGQFHNGSMSPQRPQHQQASAQQHQPAPEHLQCRRCLSQASALQKPPLPLRKGRQTFPQDFNYQHISSKQALGQNLQPRQLPGLETPPQPLTNHLQFSLVQMPSLQLSRGKEALEEFGHQQNSTKQAMDQHPQLSKSRDLQVLLTNDQQASSSRMGQLWCDLCDVPCMNDFCYEQHLQGKKHRAKWEEAYGNSKEIAMKKHKLLWCNECSVPCVNELAMAQHLHGKKHALRLLELQILNVGGLKVTKPSDQV